MLQPIEACAWSRVNHVWAHPAESNLYLIQEGESGPVKVGVANHPMRRLSALQGGNPRPLRLVAVWAGARRHCLAIEGRIKQSLRDYSLVGEWFECHPTVPMGMVGAQS